MSANYVSLDSHLIEQRNLSNMSTISEEEFLKRVLRPLPVVDNEQTRTALEKARKELMDPCNNIFIHNDICEFEKNKHNEK
jgi:hypothetical protein